MKLTLVQDNDITLLITGNYGQANIESELRAFYTQLQQVNPALDQ